MNKARMEAFSDGVVAIIITILVLELRIPHAADASALVPLLPVFLTYVLSFVHVAIYWNNHHHMLHAAQHITGGALWANMHLLFWLSLVPFVTGWMGENHFAPIPVAAYGFVLLWAAIAYFILSQVLRSSHGRDSVFVRGLGRDRKGTISALAYLAAVPLAFVHTFISLGIYIAVAASWLVPDRRFQRAAAREDSGG